MKIEEKTILWKPVSEYTGGRVLATNGLDILVGELNPEGDCVSEDCSGIHLCGITHFAKIAGFFPELKESEDERIRNQIINFIEEYGNPIHCEWQKDWIAWLEKQGESTDINPSEFDLRLNKLLKQFETLSKEELASSLSFYLNVVQNDGTYKDEEKQGEQKPTMEGIFVNVDEVREDFMQEVYRVLDADSTNDRANQIIYAFDNLPTIEFEKQGEQNPADKLEDEEYNREDYGIDSLFHAQRILEKTLGKVDGYQTDDGILSHQCAITAVKKLYEHKPAKWSEEDIRNIDVIDTVLFYDKDLPENTCVRLRNWLESLKPQNNITDEELVQAKKDAYNDALDKIEYHSGEPTFDDGWSAAIDYIRKKYLRPQQQWKPTEEQVSTMKYLAKYYAKGCDEPTRSIIEGLYEQLKQL